MRDPENPPASAERLRALHRLQEQALRCTRCPQLAANRTTVVFGAGDPDADLLLVGEAPGRNEDLQGLPLVGASGRLLTELLDGIGLRREDVYIANVLRCRPPDNRDPLAEELAHCREYLDGQLELIRPKVVATLGSFATKLLRQDPARITRIHGQAEVRTIGSRTVRLLPLFHPAAALYQRHSVELLRRDLAQVPALLALPAPAQPAPVAVPELPPPADARPPEPEDAGGDEQLGLF